MPGFLLSRLLAQVGDYSDGFYEYYGKRIRWWFLRCRISRFHRVEVQILAGTGDQDDEFTSTAPVFG